MVVGDDESVIGDTTNVAARLQSEARDGDVIVGEGTERLIEDLVTLAPLGALALRIPLNTAARVAARARTFERAGDTDALRGLCASALAFEDRRRLVRVTGDLATFLENGRSIGADIFRHTTRELLATCGDRLCLHLNRFSGTPESGEFEIEDLERARARFEELRAARSRASS